MMVPYGLTAGDLNGDGRADLVVSHSQNLSVFYQTAAGMPASPANLPPFLAESLAIADINSDGRNDLVGASSAGQVGTLLQSAAGTLSAVLTDALPSGTEPASRRALALGDLDGDGGPDAAVAVLLYTAELTVLYRTPLHDLGISIVDAPDPAPWGGNVTYTVAVANQGAAAVSGVGLGVTLPPGLSLVSVNPTTPTCTGGGDTVSCALGGMAFRQSKEVTVVARADVLGSVTVDAAGTLAESDPEPANNTASQTTLVDLPACGNPVEDGSFEQGELSIPWKATSTNFGTPIRSFGTCGSGGGMVGPRTGIFWPWFGGANRPELGTLTQTVTLQRGRATLSPLPLERACQRVRHRLLPRPGRREPVVHRARRRSPVHGRLPPRERRSRRVRRWRGSQHPARELHQWAGHHQLLRRRRVDRELPAAHPLGGGCDGERG
jgi:uncharacterized repeat protein (TIGR01451 family)